MTPETRVRVQPVTALATQPVDFEIPGILRKIEASTIIMTSVTAER
jgi:hypothetical protein